MSDSFADEMKKTDKGTAMIILYNSRAWSKILVLTGGDKMIAAINARMEQFGWSSNGCAWIVPGTLEP